MHNPRISIIAAIGTKRELGKQGDLIWRISDDLKRLKQLTTGHTLVMGRKTYDSIGRPLPDRETIVISRSTTDIPGCHVVSSVDAALAKAKAIEAEEVFIFGGGQIYQECLPQVERLYLTKIEATDSEADTFFPAYETKFPTVISGETHRDEEIPYRYEIRERSPV